MIDVHCHFDMDLNPEKFILGNEKRRIITIGMTNLPSHFQMGIDHIRRYKYIRLALGLHPLRAKDHAGEYEKFIQLVDHTSYIGEVGLDFSREGFPTKDIQVKSFELVLDCVKAKKKLLSIHSRRAEKETLEFLIEKGIRNAIFHWYSGSLSTLHKIIDAGFYFSINYAMVQSDGGQKIITEIPRELMLTETDYPYVENKNMSVIYHHLSKLWDDPILKVEQTIDSNFRRIIHNLE